MDELVVIGYGTQRKGDLTEFHMLGYDFSLV